MLVEEGIEAAPHTADAQADLHIVAVLVRDLLIVGAQVDLQPAAVRLTARCEAVRLMPQPAAVRLTAQCEAAHLMPQPAVARDMVAQTTTRDTNDR